MKENAREQLLSGDIYRMGALGSREVQNIVQDLGSSWGGGPVSGLNTRLALNGAAGGYAMTLGANGGFFYDPTFAGLTADDSAYLVLRWPDTSLAFANPDGTNGRIDLVIADPQSADADLVSRNILVDPSARAITPQNVYKTSNPASVLTVITGTPAGTPAPPALPAHKVAVAEVYVPPAVADSTSFQVAPRLWRKSMHPASTFNAILDGCNLAWDVSVNPATTSTTLGLSGDYGTGRSTPHQIFIDGELIEFSGNSPFVFADIGANPFGSAAPAGNSKPYYVYMCGGRNQPQGRFSSGKFYPIVLVESLTAPDSNGHPTAPVATPRGNTTLGAVFVGVGWVYKNTTNRQPAIMDANFVYAKGALEDYANDTTTPRAFLSLPASSARRSVLLNVFVSGGNPVTQANLYANPSSMGAPTGPSDSVAMIQTNGASGSMANGGQLVVPLDDASTGVAYLMAPGGTAQANWSVRGVGHTVRRI